MITRLLDCWKDWRAGKQLEQNRKKAPTTLDEAVDRVIAGMTDQQKVEVAATDRHAAFIGCHLTGGMWMRNNWDLWGHDSALCCYLSSCGFYHGDDRSGLIYHATWCRLSGNLLDIAAEAERNRRHWELQGINPDGTPIPGWTKTNNERMVTNLVEKVSKRLPHKRRRKSR